MATLLLVPRFTFAQATTADSSRSSEKPKREAPNLAFSIGLFSAPLDSANRGSGSQTLITFIPKRWPRWEVGFVGYAANGELTEFLDPTGNPYYTFLNATGTSLLVGHRWAPTDFIRLGVRGTAGSLGTKNETCRYASSAYSCVKDSKSGRIGAGSINALTELKIWRWIHADVSVGYRVTGRVPAPPPVTGSAMSGFTYGWALRLGKFP